MCACLFIHLLKEVSLDIALRKQQLKADQKLSPREFLEVQWLGLCTSTAGAQVQFLVRELRFCMPHGQPEKEAKSPIKRCMDKEDVVYTHQHTHTHTQNEHSVQFCSSVVSDYL